MVTIGIYYYNRHRQTENIVASKYLIQEKEKVKVEARLLRDLIQSAFVVQLLGLYESPLNCVLVTEYLAGGDLVTRTAADDFCLTERKCQIFIRQVSPSFYSLLLCWVYNIIIIITKCLLSPMICINK